MLNHSLYMVHTVNRSPNPTPPPLSISDENTEDGLLSSIALRVVEGKYGCTYMGYLPTY